MPFETSPVSISEVISFLDELLDPGAFDDMGPNGLQTPPPTTREAITRVVPGKKKKRASLIQRLLGNKGSKPAFRGVMPKNDFMARAALPLMGPAEQDLRVLVQKNVTRLLRR